jgi:hypothetical protein
MSRNINVNPGHYKVAGRERQGEDILQQQQKQLFAQQPGGGHHGDVPPWEATRHSFVTAQPEPDRKPAKAPKKPLKAKTRKAATSKKARTARKSTKAKKPAAAGMARKTTKRRPAKRSAAKTRR